MEKLMPMVGKHQGKRPIRRPRHRWKNTVKRAKRNKE
jgi:hypothetical protein